MDEIKAELHKSLRSSRAVLLAKLDGLSEYDRRRPLLPSGTNLLGLVKHLAGLEYEYLVRSLGREVPEQLAWVEDGSIWDGADMWVLPSESSDYIIGLYQRACAAADRTISELDLSAPAHVAHWEDGRSSLGQLLIRMVGETAHHAGHADIVRELIDGQGGTDADALDESARREYTAKIQQAAETFRGLGADLTTVTVVLSQ